MLVKIYKSIFLPVSIFALFFSPSAFAWNAIIHSFSQVPGGTSGSIIYSCWGTHSCQLSIMKNGSVQVSTTVTQGSFLTYSFDYGAGEYVIRLTSNRSVPGSHGVFYASAQKISNLSVGIYAGGNAISRGTIYTYDPLGRLKTVRTYGGKVTTYDYDKADNRTYKTITN